MSRLRLSEQLKLLQVKQQQLNQQVVGLAAQKRALQLRQAVLSCWCDALTLMQLSLLAQPDASPGDTDSGQLNGLSAKVQAAWQSDAANLHGQQTSWDAEGRQFQQLLQREVQLLQHLASSSTDAGSCQPTLEQLLHPDDTTTSIYSDPMQYLYQFLDRPPMPEAATMTGLDAAKIMQITVQRLSIQLHQLQSVSPWEQQSTLSKMKDTWDRYLHCISSLVLLGREDIVEAAHGINLESLESQPQEAAKQQVNAAAAAVPLLQLSEQQEELIACGTRVHYDLLGVVHSERQDINSQMTALQAQLSMQPSSKLSTHHSAQRSDTTAARDSTADGGLGVGSWKGCSSSEQQLETLPGRQELLQKQQKLIDRLMLLLHKEYKLRMAAMSWFIGCLSFEQFSKLAVLSWPYAMRTLFVATEVMQQWEKHMEQRLQAGSSK